MLLKYISDETVSDRLGYTWATLLILSATVYCYLNALTFYLSEVFGMQIRAAYSSLIYRKVTCFYKRHRCTILNKNNPW